MSIVQTQPHDPNPSDNAVGGAPGTHEGHADLVPPGYGGGMGGADELTPGNASGIQARLEAEESGSAYPVASGTQPSPVNQ